MTSIIQDGRLKITRRLSLTIVMILCIFPFFPPQSLQYTLNLPFSFDLMCFLWRTMVGVYGIIMYTRKNHFVFTSAVFSVLLFCVVYALLSFFTSIKIDYTFYFMISVVGIACLLELWVQRYDTQVLRAIWIYLLFLFVINSFLMYMYPEGVYRRYVETYQYTGWHYDVYERFSFIGGDNGFMTYGIPLWYSGMLLVKRNQLKKIWLIIGILLVNIDIIVIFSVTSLVGIVVLDVLTFLLLSEKPIKITWHKVILLIVASNSIILGFGTNSWIISLVEKYFGKALTFSIRIGIWQECFNRILSSPLIGYGNAKTWYSIEYAGRIYATHNLWLCVLIQGGFILLACFVFLLYSIVKGREKFRDYADGLIAYAVMLSIGIMGIAETLAQSFGFWFLLALLGATKYLKKL